MVAVGGLWLSLSRHTLAVTSPLYGQQTYRPINPSLPPAHAPRWAEMPLSCIEEIIASGADCTGWKMPQKFDFTYTWANPTDPIYRPNHKSVKEALLKSRIVTNPDASKWHYRDYDELRHSTRSLLDHFRPYANQFTILATDFPSDGLTPSSPHRIGQMPQWLDIDLPHGTSQWKDGDIELKIQYPAEYFDKCYGTTFNSLAIESQMGNL
ncbi:unnamed protein product [Peniophora sp. CBMAI 1063]|nr:unnamed protein product [Peniophora sp. CBMAI 1063]